MYIFDAHQDLADALLYSSHGNFWRKNRINQGWNDLNLPVNNQSDFVRLKRGEVKAVFGVSCAFATNEKGEIIPCPNHLRETLKQIRLYHQLVKEGKGKIKIIKKYSDLNKIKKHDLNFLLTIEGADSIDNQLKNLDKFFSLGVRCLGLTWSYDNKLAGGCNQKGELTPLGRKTIKQMEKLGILLDLSHLNQKSFYQALKVSNQPVIVSHTACKSIHDHPRNLTDKQIKAVAKTGGAIGICGVPKFIGKLEIKSVIKHCQQVINLVGVDHLIIGSDFGAMTAEKLIPNFQEVSDLPKLIKLLKKQGLTQEETEKISHKNIERILSTTLPD